MRKKYRHLNYEDRVRIKEYCDNSLNQTEIAKKLGVTRSTISRELKRGIINGEYDPEYAEGNYRENVSHRGTERLVSRVPGMAEFISDCILKKNLSPEKIVDLIKSNNKFSNITVTKQTLYSAIYEGAIPGVSKESLRKSVTSINSDGLIWIPKWIQDEYGFFVGDKFRIVIDENKIELEKCTEI